jgi:hypothetical protein
MTTLLTDEVRAWIGRRVTYNAPEPVGHASLRYFARAVGDDDPIHVDEAAARASGYPGVVAPPTMICESIQYMDSPRDEEGYIGHIWRLPVQGCRRLRGGCEYEFVRPLTPDVILSVEWLLSDIVEKPSSSRGGTMLLATSVVSFRDQSGELLATSTETTIFQPYRAEEGILA